MNNSDKYPSISEMIERAAHILPSQSPLHAFVHHNTLHAFEDLPFKEALRAASETFNAEPFMSEQYFAEAVQNGRIMVKDIEFIVNDQISDLDNTIFRGAPTRRAILLWRLSSLFDVPRRESINWWLHEKGLLDAPHPLAGSAASSPASSLFLHSRRKYLSGELSSLWSNLDRAAPSKERRCSQLRPRDFILAHADKDIDELTKPFLIRYSAAYLDQGVGTSMQPDKQDGFLACFRGLYEISGAPLPGWLKGIQEECQAQIEGQKSAVEVIAGALDYLEVEPRYQQSFITETAKVLRGWAGMFRQFELQPDKVPVNAYPAKLEDFLAVQLTVEKIVFKNLCAQLKIDPRAYKNYLSIHGEGTLIQRKSVQDIYEAFVTAQAFDMPAQAFDDEQHASDWVKEIGLFDSFQRRYLLHLAYERAHRNHILDGLIEHQQHSLNMAKEDASFQAIFCMDEREESTRRHLEESCPAVQTFGCAGFFGVAMQYQGLDDVTSRPLCPVNRIPKHFVREVALDSDAADIYQKWRKLRGTYSQRTLQNEAIISIGPFWSLLMGIAKTPSIILQSLFPSFTERTKERFFSLSPARPATRLQLFRGDEAELINGMFSGYSIAEAADVVQATLASIGLTSNFAPFVVIVGHGSSSLNNPHEAAHDCGATGGGRGGPNARAFAMMANHFEVRATLEQRGLCIPEATQFVGAYHNTCDDSMRYFDTDLLPQPCLPEYQQILSAFAEACELDALERCRKFEEVPLDVDPKQATGYVHQHSIDLAQPRPEYGHATNAVCIIGRREKTRGLFMDRRSFLISYDPKQDPDRSIIAGILESAGPVGAGINLEYYFSFVDPVAYGCGTKLPHNISGLIGVMEGHSSDLRTGLPWQMVEIHEPVRLLTIVEATPEDLLTIAQEKEVVGRLVGNGWIQLVSLHPLTGEVQIFENGGFVCHRKGNHGFPIFPNSEDFFRGSDTYLGLAHIGSSETLTGDLEGQHV